MQKKKSCKYTTDNYVVFAHLNEDSLEIEVENSSNRRVYAYTFTDLEKHEDYSKFRDLIENMEDLYSIFENESKGNQKDFQIEIIEGPKIDVKVRIGPQLKTRLTIVLTEKQINALEMCERMCVEFGERYSKKNKAIDSDILVLFNLLLNHNRETESRFRDYVQRAKEKENMNEDLKEKIERLSARFEQIEKNLSTFEEDSKKNKIENDSRMSALEDNTKKNQTENEKRLNELETSSKESQTKNKSQIDTLEENLKKNQTENENRIKALEENYKKNQTDNNKRIKALENNTKKNQTENEKRLNELETSSKENQTKNKNRIDTLEENLKKNQTENENRLKFLEEDSKGNEIESRIKTLEENSKKNQTDNSNKIKTLEDNAKKSQTEGQKKINDLEEKSKKTITEYENKIKALEESLKKNHTENEARIKTLEGDSKKGATEFENRLKVLEEDSKKNQTENQSKITALEDSSKKIEAFHKYFKEDSVNANPIPIKSMDKILKSEALVIDNMELELFLSAKELLVQAEDLKNFKTYYKIFTESNIKDLTSNAFEKVSDLFDALQKGLKDKKKEVVIDAVNNKITYANKTNKNQKFEIVFDRLEADSLAGCERFYNKFTGREKTSGFVFEKLVLNLFGKVIEQEKKSCNRLAQAMDKIEQIESNLESIQTQ